MVERYFTGTKRAIRTNRQAECAPIRPLKVVGKILSSYAPIP